MSGRILVLDDEENYAEMLQDLLLQNNYRVDMVTRPERAIDRLEEVRYDLVVSDYKMPVMDGADFLKRAREIYPDLPFILVSGLMNTPELVKVANMSVTLVLEKPLDTDLFLEHVRRFSEPMSDDEASTYKASGEGVRVQEEEDLPDVPSFYSIRCRASRDFLGQAWRIASRSSVVVLLDGKGGDAGLAVRDLSIWKAQRDREIVRMDLLSVLAEDAPLALEKIATDDTKSDVVLVSGSDFNPKRDIDKIAHLEERTLQKVRGGEKLVLVIVLPEPVRDMATDEALVQEFGDRLAVNPALRHRLPDLAHYVRQQANAAKPPIRFSQDAVFALLSLPWPGNLTQVREAVGRVVAGGGDEVVSLERLSRSIGVKALEAMPAGNRMGTLLRLQQAEVLRDVEKREVGGAEKLAAAFGLSVDVSGGAGDFEELPLLKPELAEL